MSGVFSLFVIERLDRKMSVCYQQLLFAEVANPDVAKTNGLAWISMSL